MVTFFGLLVHNLWTKKVRTVLTALAVAVGVMTVVTLSVVTDSLRSSAAAVLETGKADFTVAQKGVDGALNSVIDDAQVSRMRQVPGVRSVVGALVVLTELDADNPAFLEIGLQPSSLTDFGVRIVEGRAYAADASKEVMLGWRAADNFGKHVGDTIDIAGGPKTIVGIYRTGQAFGDGGAMFPLTFLQADERRAGTVTLAFVRVAPRTKIDAVRHRLEQDNPSLATVRFVSEFGRVDRTLDYLNAAGTGAVILALVIGTVIVMNTMLLSFVERTREFGVLRAIGWSRRRLWALILGEALLISLGGAAIGVGLAVVIARLLEELPAIHGILHAQYSAESFWRALSTAGVIGLLAALYPAARAGRLQPLAAMRRE
ncbi:MAG TPA: ABC transporter permease [Acidimicrobiia bacterium]|jgi:putative ABC transport system permease protein|nr:ABC transporter permease [Acidimicrobiia bacterium]